MYLDARFEAGALVAIAIFGALIWIEWGSLFADWPKNLEIGFRGYAPRPAGRGRAPAGA